MKSSISSASPSALSARTPPKPTPKSPSANSSSARFYPKLVRIAQKISQELLPFYGSDLVAEYDDIRPTDAKARLEEIRTAYPLLSVNELRATYFQLPPVAWGENPPLNLPPSGQGETFVAKSAIENELAQWERFALNRLDRADARPFEVTAIPDEVGV